MSETTSRTAVGGDDRSNNVRWRVGGDAKANEWTELGRTAEGALVQRRAFGGVHASRGQAGRLEADACVEWRTQYEHIAASAKSWIGEDSMPTQAPREDRHN